MTSKIRSSGIVADGLTVAHRGRPVVSGVDLRVVPGRVTGLIGPSGSGKTSVLRALAGLQPIAAGAVVYDGEPRPAPGSLGMLAQHPRQVCDPRWTLGRIVVEPAAIRGERTDPAEWAQRAGLDPELLDRRPGQVSDGQLQRACLARILVQDPAYLLCDEPVAMLDPITARAVIAVLADLVDRGAGALLVSHDHRLVHAVSGDVVTLPRSVDGAT
ncbi:MAG: ATP-binding cassette domain-containing protein [Gordonia sp. (in: high G+C Gram-positive bacteria)]|uniref:ABC transporter ATP-binding protein n=1 Tax=Gordonia sp. (in: high G+C Gram-positive bacteria) TaxID=84139 RepID=UPI0039E24A21